jgi:hypothetical protein
LRQEKEPAKVDEALLIERIDIAQDAEVHCDSEDVFVLRGESIKAQGNKNVDISKTKMSKSDENKGEDSIQHNRLVYVYLQFWAVYVAFLLFLWH